MELIERAGFLTSLKEKFIDVRAGEGHSVFVSGEAGIGKTSLVRAFCHELKTTVNIFQGTCDALFTPRPLAPLYDILLQTGHASVESDGILADRAAFFTRFFHELRQLKEPTLIVFEDIHWADEATLDFIKFLGRRITQLRCLFILTYRDDEIHARHPLRNLLGQLNPDTFTRLQLLPLSRQAVDRLAGEKGYNGEDVYHISGGNPFYVTEILASYSPGVPENIKDSILSVYDQQEEKTRHVWDLLSIFPAGFEIRHVEKIDPTWSATIQKSLDSRILILKDGFLFFKHELYRRTIEASLSPPTRVCYNKKVLDNFRGIFEQNQEIEKIIHHAKNAGEYELVVQYVPQAAAKAASVGAHIEASRLYLSAIEYYKGGNLDTLLRFYESYAYECYLISQFKEAIVYTGKALECWQKKNDTEKTGNCMRFLSRLYWFDGNRQQAESWGGQAIEILDRQPASSATAMAYSNMSQLKMLSDQAGECISWGEKATAIARELGDQETLCHALNNTGAVRMRSLPSLPEGRELLQQSLKIALANSYHEHAARAYTNLGGSSVIMKEYAFAKKILDEGILYCEKRDLDSWSSYMIAWGRARHNLETGSWKEAYGNVENFLKNETLTPVIRIGALIVAGTIRIRKGEPEGLPLLLEAKNSAFGTREPHRIIPALVALLEYEWITGKTCIDARDLDQAIRMIATTEKIFENNDFSFWLSKARKGGWLLKDKFEGYATSTVTEARRAAAIWEALGSPYGQALALFEGTEDDKRAAVTIVHGLGAAAVYEKMKTEMKASGIKNIPRGMRKSTRSNSAKLTGRELDVLLLLKEGLPNKEIAASLFISAKTVDHHISAILYKLEVNSRAKAVQEATRLEIIK